MNKNKEQLILYNTEVVKVQQNQLLKSDPLVFEYFSYAEIQLSCNTALINCLIFIKYEYLQKILLLNALLSLS